MNTISIEILQGIKTFPALEKSLKLPVLIPSHFAAIGKYNQTNFLITSKGKAEAFLTSILRYQISQVDE